VPAPNSMTEDDGVILSGGAQPGHQQVLPRDSERDHLHRDC
jgi:hypothetical protein